MNKQIIDELANEIGRAIAPTVANYLFESDAARGVLEEYFSDKIAIIWSIHDILKIAEHIDISIDESDAHDILHSLHSNHDPDIGITWDVVQDYIVDHIEQKENGDV